MGKKGKRMNLESIKNKIEQEKGKRDLLLSQIQGQKDQRENTENKLKIGYEAYELILEVVNKIQGFLKFRISGMVSKALEVVFDDPYTFEIDFVFRRDQMECDLYLVQNKIRFSPIDSVGFGDVDVCSFVLRVSLLSLMRARVRPVIILDEPFKQLSSDFQSKVGELIKELSERLGIQFIIVSHRDRVIEKGADKIFKISKNPGKERTSKATEMEV